MKTAMNSQMKYSAFSGIFRLPSYRKEEDQVTARAMELLADGEALRRMSENLEKLARPDAAERIVDEIEKVMK